MTGSVDAINAVIESGRGSRPYSLQDREAEQVLNIAMALLVELTVSNERIDRLERLLAEMRGVPVETLCAETFGDEANKARQDAMEAMQLRVLRVLIDPREAVDGHPDAR